MLQNQKFADCILQKEDWLLAKTFNSSDFFQSPEFEDSFNFPWRNTVVEINRLAVDILYQYGLPDQKDFLNFSNNLLLLNLSQKEIEENINYSVNEYHYVFFLKTLQRSYISILEHAVNIEKEKRQYISYINNLFGSYELVYIREYTRAGRYNGRSPEAFETDLLQQVINNLNVPAVLIDFMINTIIQNNKVHKLFNANNLSRLLSRIIFSDKTTFRDKIASFIQSELKEEIFESKIILNTKSYYLGIAMNKITGLDLVLITFIDYTAWKDMEHSLIQAKQRAVESDKLKTAFLANMSHEIRTPMNAIVGFAELLVVSRPNSKERVEYLNLIRKSSNDLLNIIEDVIDIAKIESKQLRIVPMDTNLYTLIKDLRLLYSESLKRNGKENVRLVEFVLEEEKELILRTDAKRLKQILSNLINNAVKFTDEGIIEFGYKVNEDKLVYFFVKDSGIGIPYKLQRKIFDRFVQVEESITKNKTGTGLGLAISKNLVNLLGGKIWVSSKPGLGSNFIFYIPYAKPNQKKIKDESEIYAKKTDENNPLKGITVLVAEDEDINFYYLRELFKELEVSVIRARNGLEVVNFVEQNNSIDIILMDIKMPVMNGIQATRYIKNIKPELPIIAITAFAMDNDRETCLEAGCVDYISKPIKREKLLNTVQNAIKVHSNQM